MLKNLIGNHVSMILKDPKWVSFSGPETDLARGWGFFSPDDDDRSVYIAWNKSGIICEVDGRGEHYREVIE